MSHSQQHERLIDLHTQLHNASEEIYINYHNGDKKLNRRIMAIKHIEQKLGERLLAHAEATEGDDEKLEKYAKIKKQRNAAFVVLCAAVPSLLTYIFMLPS